MSQATVSHLEVFAPHQRAAMRAAEDYLLRDFGDLCTADELAQLVAHHYLDLRDRSSETDPFLPLMVQRAVRAHLITAAGRHP